MRSRFFSMWRRRRTSSRDRWPASATAALATVVLCAILAGCQTLPGVPIIGSRPGIELVYVGQQILPHALQFANTTVGGLSGIDYDASTGRYWLISDDRSELGPARFYEATLDLSRFTKAPNPGHAAIEFTSVQTLKRLDGSVFADYRTSPAQATDPESIRVHAPSGRLIWASEGERNVRAGEPPVLAQPHVWEMERDGRMLRPFVIPDKFRASAANRGVRRNLGFEGLTFSPDFSTVFAALENALLQDGPSTTPALSSPTRLLVLDYASGQPRGEFVIDVSLIPAASPTAGGFADNGISEILALDRDRLLVLERAFVHGIGNFIKLFVVDLRGATDVSKIESLATQSYVAVSKRLVLDLSSLGIRLDNIEGMTWGPRRADGRRTLLMISDDNFNARQIQQFLLFELRE